MSFESFAQSLAYMLIKEHGGVEGPEMEIDDFPAHKVVSTQSSSIIITKGDGLTGDQIKRHTEQMTAKLNSGIFPASPILYASSMYLNIPALNSGTEQN